MNTIVQNVNVDRPLVAILDPRLAIPPAFVEPTTTRDAPELEPNLRFGNRLRGGDTRQSGWRSTKAGSQCNDSSLCHQAVARSRDQTAAVAPLEWHDGQNQ